MLLEKVPWCTHDGGVYTIHVQHTGRRFATGGADAQVKIWSMAPILDAQKEKGGAPLVLATLSDHSSTVNTVRFSKNGRFLASGSDDRMICIYEHKAGPGGATLGGGPASLENWRTKLVLRGHSNNVVDLGWSHDDALLASCSIDNSVCVWNPASGQRLKTLDYHTSFVKGLAWDPVGSYLATQSEDKSVVIWRCDDWSLAARITAPYSKLVTSTFSTRMSWSPDGSFLATGNSYQGSSHAAVVIQRGRWNEDKEHMLVSGHQGCVVSIGFNPRLFHLPKKGGSEGEVEDKLSSVFALGSQDKRISVWAAAQPIPLVVGKRFFRSQVTDLAWSPDGHILLAASSDGSVACFQFSTAELGTPHTQAEMDQIFQQLYGSTRGAVGGKRLFAESADQLALEAAAAAAAAASPRGGGPAAAAVEAAAAGRAGAGAAAKLAGAAQQQQQAAVERALQPSAKQNLDALSARMSGRMGGGGGAGEVQEGFDAPAASGEGPPAAAAGGRKRLVPELLGQQQGAAPAAPGALMPPPPPRPSGQEAKRVRLEPGAGLSAKASQQLVPAGASTRGVAELAARPPAGAAGAGAGGLAVGPPMQRVELRRAEVPAEVVADLGLPPRLFEDPAAASQPGPGPAAEGAGAAGSEPHRRVLRVVNRERGGGARVQAEVECQEGGAPVWSDTLRGAAVAACGTHNFAAVGLADGHLMLYSRAGRHLTAPLKLGMGIAKLACDAAWRLLAVTTTGSVRLFDVEAQHCLLTASLLPLLEDGCTVLDARLSRMGVPLVTLSNSRAYVWSAALEGWACVADESFAASQFVPFMNLPGQGEISNLQAEALRAAIPRAALPSLQIRGGLSAAAAQLASRAHLEASLATALALQSPLEYRRWLLAYARFLAEQGDAGRLGELCASLLGSNSGGGGGLGGTEAAPVAAADHGGGWHAGAAYSLPGGAPGAAAAAGEGEGALVVAAAGGGGEQGPAAAPAAAAATSRAWAQQQSTVLGLSKWGLLREVLKEMGRNRSLQRTTQTYLDALSELERAAERAAATSAAATAGGGSGGGGAGGGSGSGALQLTAA